MRDPKLSRISCQNGRLSDYPDVIMVSTGQRSVGMVSITTPIPTRMIVA